MTIREQIVSDIQSIGNSKVLFQIWEFIHLMRKHVEREKSNRNIVLAFSGTLSDEEAQAISDDVQAEFSKIEGDW